MRKIALVALLATSACAAGPDYRPPQAPATTAGAFVSTAPAVDSAQPLPDNWWRLYNDPVLDRLIAQAFAANTDLRVAAANLARARAVLGEARAARLPTTDLSGGASYGDSTQSGFSQGGGSKQWSYNGGLAVAWEADLFGRIGRGIEAARADAQASEAARDMVRVTVAAETARSYADACAYGAAAAIARDSVTTADRNLSVVTSQEQAGSVGKFDVERAATAAANARAAVPPIDAQRSVALFELAALMGQTPAGVPDEARQCAVPPAPASALPVGDGAALLRRRPDLRQAERSLAADTARIGVAMADLYPKISLGASGNYFRSDDVRGSNSFSFSVGPLISWSFPNIAVARSRIRQARAQGDASLATFDGKVIGALKEVEQALSRYDGEERQLAALHEARTRAERAFQFADARYRAGSISYLDVLVAQNDLITARAAEASSTQQLGSARIDLFKALGGGWQPSS